MIPAMKCPHPGGQNPEFCEPDMGADDKTVFFCVYRTTGIHYDVHPFFRMPTPQ